MKVIWIDTETTGCDPIRNDIWQLAYIFKEGEREVRRNTIECRPYSMWNIDSKALEVSHTSIEYISSLTSPWHSFSRLQYDLTHFINQYDTSDKAAVGGYNVAFDLNFLSWWFKKSGEKYGLGSFTDYTILDAAPLARQMRYLQYRNFRNTKLSTLCEYYEIPLDNAHNAMADADASMKLYPLVLSDYVQMLNKPFYLGELSA